MAWPTFILIAVLIACFSGALIGFESPSQQLAETRGWQLLLNNLNPEQRRQYESFGYFDVVGSRTGKRYRINNGTSRNVVEIASQNRPGPGRCFTPMGELVAGDCMLAQKIALENFEDQVLQVALTF